MRKDLLARRDLRFFTHSLKYTGAQKSFSLVKIAI